MSVSLPKFHDVLEKDIDYLLKSNNISAGENKYLTAWNLLLQNNNKEFYVPKSIYNFIVNYNMNIKTGTEVKEVVTIKEMETKEVSLDTLPLDIIKVIFGYLDEGTLPEVFILNKSTYSWYYDIIRIYIGRRTNYNISNFNNNELKNLYLKLRVGLTKLSAEPEISIIKNGVLYSNVVLNKKNKLGYKIELDIKKVGINTKFKQVSYDMFLDNNGSVRKFGDYFGVFRLYDDLKLTNKDDFVKISANKYHFLLLKKGGEVGTGGINKFGQLGYKGSDFVEEANLEDLKAENAFYHVPQQFKRKYKDISAGRFHSLLLSIDGIVYSCGLGNYGQLGNNDKRNYVILQRIDIPEEVYMIHAGNNTSFVITVTGNVYAFGLNDYGQLGLGDHENRYMPTLVPNLNNVVDIAGGDYSTLFLTAEGDVYGCGNNEYYFDRDYNKSVPTKIQKVKNIIQLSTSSGIHAFGSYLYLDNEGNYYNGYGKLELEKQKPNAEINAIVKKKIGKVDVKTLKEFIKKNNYEIRAEYKKDDLIMIAYKIIKDGQ
jgi:hypothetical protein